MSTPVLNTSATGSAPSGFGESYCIKSMIDMVIDRVIDNDPDKDPPSPPQIDPNNRKVSLMGNLSGRQRAIITASSLSQNKSAAQISPSAGSQSSSINSKQLNSPSLSSQTPSQQPTEAQPALSNTRHPPSQASPPHDRSHSDSKQISASSHSALSNWRHDHFECDPQGEPIEGQHFNARSSPNSIQRTQESAYSKSSFSNHSSNLSDSMGESELDDKLEPSLINRATGPYSMPAIPLPIPVALPVTLSIPLTLPGYLIAGHGHSDASHSHRDQSSRDRAATIAIGFQSQGEREHERNGRGVDDRSREDGPIYTPKEKYKHSRALEANANEPRTRSRSTSPSARHARTGSRTPLDSHDSTQAPHPPNTHSPSRHSPQSKSPTLSFGLLCEQDMAPSNSPSFNHKSIDLIGSAPLPPTKRLLRRAVFDAGPQDPANGDERIEDGCGPAPASPSSTLHKTGHTSPVSTNSRSRAFTTSAVRGSPDEGLSSTRKRAFNTNGTETSTSAIELELEGARAAVLLDPGPYSRPPSSSISSANPSIASVLGGSGSSLTLGVGLGRVIDKAFLGEFRASSNSFSVTPERDNAAPSSAPGSSTPSSASATVVATSTGTCPGSTDNRAIRATLGNTAFGMDLDLGDLLQAPFRERVLTDTELVRRRPLHLRTSARAIEAELNRAAELPPDLAALGSLESLRSSNADSTLNLVSAVDSGAPSSRRQPVSGLRPSSFSGPSHGTEPHQMAQERPQPSLRPNQTQAQRVSANGPSGRNSLTAASLIDAIIDEQMNKAEEELSPASFITRSATISGPPAAFFRRKLGNAGIALPPHLLSGISSHGPGHGSGTARVVPEKPSTARDGVQSDRRASGASASTVPGATPASSASPPSNASAGGSSRFEHRAHTFSAAGLSSLAAAAEAISEADKRAGLVTELPSSARLSPLGLSLAVQQSGRPPKRPNPTLDFSPSSGSSRDSPYSEPVSSPSRGAGEPTPKLGRQIEHSKSSARLAVLGASPSMHEMGKRSAPGPGPTLSPFQSPSRDGDRNSSSRRRLANQTTASTGQLAQAAPAHSSLSQQTHQAKSTVEANERTHPPLLHSSANSVGQSQPPLPALMPGLQFPLPFPFPLPASIAPPAGLPPGLALGFPSGLFPPHMNLANLGTLGQPPGPTPDQAAALQVFIRTLQQQQQQQALTGVGQQKSAVSSPVADGSIIPASLAALSGVGSGLGQIQFPPINPLLPPATAYSDNTQLAQFMQQAQNFAALTGDMDNSVSGAGRNAGQGQGQSRSLRGPATSSTASTTSGQMPGWPSTVRPSTPNPFGVPSLLQLPNIFPSLGLAQMPPGALSALMNPAAAYTAFLQQQQQQQLRNNEGTRSGPSNTQFEALSDDDNS